MTVEERIFGRKRFDKGRMTSFGFREEGGSYSFETDFFGGDFHAIIAVDGSGKVCGKVIDKMNDEEYYQLRFENQTGTYTSAVRNAYEELLAEIAEKCCKDVIFASDQANRVTGIILDRFGVLPDFPWGESKFESYGTFRHPDSRKWFALIMDIERNTIFKNGDHSGLDIANLKIDCDDDDVKGRNGIFPAYHMNHRKWVSVLLDDTLTDEEVMFLIEKSFNNTQIIKASKK